MGKLKTVNDVCDYYLRTRADPFDRRPCQSAASIAIHLKAVRTLWGDWKLKHFVEGSRARVDKQVSEWRASGSASATCRKRLSFLKSAYRRAAEDELIDRDLVPFFHLPPEGAPRERFVDEEKELAVLLRAAANIRTPEHVELKLHIHLLTGQRSSAIHALEWDKHIDFERRLILFKETQAPGERTKKRRTNQPMSDELYDMLWAAKQRAQTPFVLEYRGKRVCNGYAGMKALYRRAKLENIHVHDLRRTAATYVNRELDGDLGAAANFIGDTEKVARAHYVQDAPETRLPQVHALSRVIARAKAAGRASEASPSSRDEGTPVPAAADATHDLGASL